MPSRHINRPKFQRRLPLALRPPLHEIVAVNPEAEEIRRDKSSLHRAEANDADEQAVGARDDPALPNAPADEHGGEDRQHARNVVKSKHLL